MNTHMAQDPSGHAYQHPDITMDPPDDSGGQSKSDAGKAEGSKAKDKRERLSRACIACHTGKTRCSNSLPCESCIKRGIGASCSYPDPSDPNAPEQSVSRRRSAPQNQAQNTSQPPQQQPQTPNQGQATLAAQPQQAQAGPGVIPGQANHVFAQNPHVRGLYYDAPGVAAASGPAFNTNGTIMTPIAAGTAGAIAAIRKDSSPPSGRPSKKARYRNLTDQEMASFSPKPYKRGTFFVGDSAPVAIDHRLPLRLMLADEERVDFFVGDLPP